MYSLVHIEKWFYNQDTTFGRGHSNIRKNTHTLKCQVNSWLCLGVPSNVSHNIENTRSPTHLGQVVFCALGFLDTKYVWIFVVDVLQTTILGNKEIY